MARGGSGVITWRDRARIYREAAERERQSGDRELAERCHLHAAWCEKMHRVDRERRKTLDQMLADGEADGFGP